MRFPGPALRRMVTLLTELRLVTDDADAVDVSMRQDADSVDGDVARGIVCALNQNTHTHTHTHIYIYVYLYIYVYTYIYIYIYARQGRTHVLVKAWGVARARWT